MKIMAKNKIKYYLLFIYSDVEPTVYGPFPNPDARDKKALELRKQEGEDHGYFPVNVGNNGKLSVNSYSGSFFG